MGRLNLTRRDFVKAAAVTAAAAAFASGAPAALAEVDHAETASTILGTDTVAVKTCCRGCGKMECGVKVIVQNGRAIRVEGDEGAFQSMGNCCTKSQSSIQAAYHPDRLHYPMKRTNPKGDNDPGWVRISWDEAMDHRRAPSLTEIQDKYGGEAIALGRSGTSRIWCMHVESGLQDRCGIRPNNVEAWQICKGPRHFATAHGPTFARAGWRPSPVRRVYVQWGGASRAVELRRLLPHHGRRGDPRRRAHLVDPRHGNLGKEADYWQHLRPGTDGALALAWTNVIIENKPCSTSCTLKKWTTPRSSCARTWSPPAGPGLAQKNDGSYYDLKTRLLKESDIVEGGSPTSASWTTTTWEARRPRASSTSTVSSPGSTPTRRASSTTRAASGRARTTTPRRRARARRPSQDNLPPGPEPGLGARPHPSPMPLRPGDRPRPRRRVRDHAQGRQDATRCRPCGSTTGPRDEYTPEIVAEICGIPADEISPQADGLRHADRPLDRLRNGGIQYMLAIEHACTPSRTAAPSTTSRASWATSTPPAATAPPTHRADRRRPQGFSAWSPAPRTPPCPRATEKQLGIDQFPLLGWWGNGPTAATVRDAVLTGEPYPSCARGTSRATS